MRRALLSSLLILTAASAAAWVGLRNKDPHYSAERRAWKNRAIEAVRRQSTAPFDPVTKDSADEWLTDTRITCTDGSWLAYRSQCHKQDQKVHDIFIAKASDGHWYYSDYHFCIGAMVLASNGQPDSLPQFKSAYFLAEFDGNSDAALAPTWQKHR